MLALVILVASQQGKTTTASLPGAPLGAPAAPGAIRGPDISAMSPRERADRLYDRVMRLSAEGKADSAAFFAPMALGAYDALAPLDIDLRYDYGRIAEMTGNLEIAKAQADSIALANPDHLLGLVLGARVAKLQNDRTAERRLFDRLIAVQARELAKGLDEYERHRGDIDAALAEARK